MNRHERRTMKRLHARQIKAGQTAYEAALLRHGVTPAIANKARADAEQRVKAELLGKDRDSRVTGNKDSEFR